MTHQPRLIRLTSALLLAATCLVPHGAGAGAATVPTQWRLRADAPSIGSMLSGDHLAAVTKTGKLLLYLATGQPPEAPTYANEAETWTWNGVRLDVGPGPSPTSRQATRMVYDEATDQVVLFGGSLLADSNTGMGDTWVWHAGRWSQAAAGPAPSRVGWVPTMVYDRAHRQIVLVDDGEPGAAGQPLAKPSVTWTWNGERWLKASTQVLTTGDARRHIAYDRSRGQVVLYEEDDRVYADSSGYHDDPATRTPATWVWTGSAWQKRSGAMPPVFDDGARMTYDATRGQVLLFGGTTIVKQQYTELWAWNGSKWNRLWQQPTSGASTGPNFNQNPELVHDAARGVDVALVPPPGGLPPQTWLWNGQKWSQVTGTGPGEYDHPLFYDPARHVTVVYAPNEHGFWELSGSQWRLVRTANPSPSTVLNAAYDEARHQVVMLDDRDPGVTWTWTGSSWSRRDTPNGPGSRARLAYDGKRVVALDTVPRSQSLGMWLWTGTTWSRYPGATPPARTGESLAYDAAHGALVLFGGDGRNTGTLGTEHHEADTVLPYWDQGIATCRSGLHTVGDDQDVVLCNLVDDAASPRHQDWPGTYGDTWTWDGKQWQQRNTPTAPPPQASASMVYDPDAGRVLLVGEHTTTTGTVPCKLADLVPPLPLGDACSKTTTVMEGWVWNGSAWTGGTIPVPPRSNAALVYDPPSKQVLLYGGQIDGKSGSSAVASDTWTWDGKNWRAATGSAPLARWPGSFALLNDPRSQQTLLFGGVDPNKYPTGDICSWAGTHWNPCVPVAVALRNHAVVVADTGYKQVVVFGGIDVGLKPLDDTWTNR